MTMQSDKAAKRFFSKLFPGRPFDYTDHPAKSLIRAAFALYQDSWRGQNFKIADWKYPFDTLEAKEPIEGDQPWTVLLRRAVELSA